MSGTITDPKDLTPEKDFFVGIDSDGCVFDSMEIKQKECFIPVTIRHWGLQGIAKYYRAAAEFVNLYSKWRGCNRWPAVTRAFDLLQDWPEPMARNPKIPPVPRMRRWLEEESVNSNATLKVLIEKETDPAAKAELESWMAWSLAVNEAVTDMVHDLPPFPQVAPTLEKMKEKADLVVVSSTPQEALQREWSEHDLVKHVRFICGQEQGKKADHIADCTGGKYPAERILMIGDAPGDRKAAEANGALFYPIIPPREEESWQRLQDEAFDRFLAGTYAGEYADALIREFEDSLPATPPWKR